jgi:hypothetical protein
MKFIHLSTEKYWSYVIVEIMLTLNNKRYYYKTSSYIEEQFKRRSKRSKNSFSAFNYLKNNSEEIKNNLR